MRPLLLLIAFSMLLWQSTAITATYAGTEEKEGPETEFTVGFASDNPSDLEISVPERRGLNISYPESISFDPDNTSRTLQRNGENIPLVEIRVQVKSVDITRSEYQIPVTLRAYRRDISQESATRPRVVQERDFVFRYLTAESPEYGYEGELIDQNRTAEVEEEQDEPDEVLNLSEENTITDETENDTQEGGEESGSRVTAVLAAAVILVFGYTIYEAVT